MLSRRRLDPVHLLVLAVLALFVVHPLIVHGCSCGHDFDFHLESWLDAAHQFRHGNLHPRWDYSAAWNAGEPRFVFYPPLSWSLGAGIALLLEHLPGISASAAWAATPIVFTWLALTLSGFSMYRVARDYALPRSALAAGTFYLANPYMLFTAYERTAYAELLAAAWIPLLLHAALRPRLSIPRLAIPLALLWLTNAPAAVIGSYMLGLLLLGRIVVAGVGTWRTGLRTEQVPRRTLRPRWLLRIADPLNLGLLSVAGTALGLLVAAFYIVPAAYERRFVQIQMAVLPGLRIEDNFLFHHTTGPDAALHDQVLHTASVIAVILWFAAAGLLLINYLLCRRPGRISLPAAGLRALPVRLLGVLTLAVGFALTPWSAPLWRVAPEAAFLQFPWRAVSVLAAVTALAIGELLTRARQRETRVANLAIAAGALLCVPCYAVFRQGCDPEDMPAAQLAAFVTGQGFAPTDEYTPVDADNDALRHTDPPYWLATNPGADPPGGGSGMAPSSLRLRLPHGEDLILNLRNFPGWTVLLDGAVDLQRLNRPDGLLAIPVPGGSSTVQLVETRLPDQKIGDLLTLLGLGFLGASGLPLRWRREGTDVSGQSAGTASTTRGAKVAVSGENPSSSPESMSKYQP